MKPASGKELKELGQAQALESAGYDWTEDMLGKLKAFIKARRDMGFSTFKMEDFRAVALVSQWEPPKSSNAWGAFTTAACRAGLIVWTGQYERAESPRTRAHDVKTWRAA